MSLADAIQLFQAGKITEAEKACTDVIADMPGNQQAHFLLASIAARQQQPTRAMELLDEALRLGPPTAAILAEYGRVLRRMRRPAEAAEKLSAAADLNRSWQLLAELGSALMESNQPDRAQAVFQDALSLNPDCPLCLRHLAQIAYMKGDTGKFVELAEQAIKLNPNDLQLMVSLIITYLQTSKAATALALCNALLAKQPSMTGAYGFKYIALAESGDMEGARDLLDLDALVRKIPARCPKSFGSIEDLNAALVDYLNNSATRTATPGKYTTRQGWQTEPGKSFEKNTALGAAVDEMIMAAVDEYTASLPADPDHPVNLTRPANTQLDTWCVVLNHGGHQAPHMHPGSWLSGVYYIRLPDDFDQQKTPDAGCITFGRGQEGLHRVDGPRTLTLKPEEGCFFMFPSYFWHNTVPLESSQQRICLAFNINEARPVSPAP